MAEIKPFRALRYDNAKIKNLADVMTPPYDIISKEQQQCYYDIHENSVIRLEFGKDQDGDDANQNKYTRAGDTLKKWIDSGVLVFDNDPALYIYEQEFSLPSGVKKSLRGVVCLVKIEEFSRGVVLPHEETLSKAKTDRFNLMSATNANFSQIYSLYLDEDKKISSKINKNTTPSVEFTSHEGIAQRLWPITDSSEISAICKEFESKQLFIADGHHRYETALNYRNELRKKGDWSDSDGFNYVMMMLVDMQDEGLVVFPTHRLVGGLENFKMNDLLVKLEVNFKVEKIVDSSGIANLLEKNAHEKCFVLYAGKSDVYLLTFANKSAMSIALPEKSLAYAELDVSVLHTLILDNILGIDAKNMANQKNLIYTRDVEYAIAAVDNKEFQCAFFLNATKVEQIKDVSLANEKMPQKSTYFYPKLITGLVMNKF